jgi:hypothetical protein
MSVSRTFKKREILGCFQDGKSVRDEVDEALAKDMEWKRPSVI